MRYRPRPLSPAKLVFASSLALAIGSAHAQQFAPPAPGFLANQGQWSSPELYRLQVAGLDMYLEQTGWSFWVRESAKASTPPGAQSATRLAGLDHSDASPRATALRMSFAGGRSAVPVAGARQHGAHNYLLGDRDSHRSGVPSFESLRYAEVFPGIDVRVRTDSGSFEYDLLVDAGADLAAAAFEVHGARGLELADDGSLVLHTALGDLTQPVPVTWMVGGDGERTPVDCRYVLRDDHTFGFEAADWDPSQALVVDPPLLYSTYVGGTLYDEPSTIVHDSLGRILLCGYTESTDFPTSVGTVQPVYGGTADGYVICIDPTLPPANQVVFATYVGGTMWDWTSSVCEVPGVGYAFAGQSQSPGLPTTPGALQSALNGNADGMVGILDPTGSTLIALTYVGGNAFDQVNTVHFHPTGNLVIGGLSQSGDFPVTPGVPQPTIAGGQDSFVALIDVTLATLPWSTYAGGTRDDWCLVGDVDAAGRILVSFGGNSQDFPTTPNALLPNYVGGYTAYWWCVDIMVGIYDPTQPPGQQLPYSSYLGGTWNEQHSHARFAPNGDIVVCGTAQSRDFPVTADAYQPTHGGGTFINNNYVAGDAFLIRIDPNVAGMAGMVWGTFLGGRGQEQGIDMAMDVDGTTTIVGWTQNGSGLPTTPDAFRRTYGANDGFVSRISADGSQLLYSTLLGGTNAADGAWDVDQHAPGIVDVGFSTSATDFPIVNGVQPTAAGDSEAAIAQLDMIADGTVRYGTPTRGQAGMPTIHPMSDAVPGNSAFGIAGTKTWPNSPGVLLLGATPLNGAPLLGVDLYVDSNSGIALTVNANVFGEHVLPLALPNMALGQVYAQYVWVETASPLTLSASDALQLF